MRLRQSVVRPRRRPSSCGSSRFAPAPHRVVVDERAALRRPGDHRQGGGDAEHCLRLCAGRGGAVAELTVVVRKRQLAASTAAELVEAAPTRPVRVTVPAVFAYDLDKFQEIQRTIFDRLGHAMCISGFDIRWRLEDDFLVDAKMNVTAR